LKKIGIIGNGSWATALAKIISAHSETEVIWHFRRPEDAAFFQEFKHNPRYLTGVDFTGKNIRITSNAQECINQSDYVVLAAPSAFLHSILEPLDLPANKNYVTAIKGIEVNSKKVIAEYLEDSWNIPSESIILVTGPCHAEEVAQEKLSYLTVSSLVEEKAQDFADLLSCRFINTKVNNDLYGAEYSAVLKNIYAIGAGILHGLSYGDNFLAVYVSAATREIEVFLEALHKTHRDVKDAAYLGDLLVTCYSQYSRNRTFGNMLGRGYSVKSAQLEMNMIAEGYYALEGMEAVRAKQDVAMPILQAVYAIVYQGQSARQIFAALSQQIN
jgi:glycerol-3-phosphate dehydrogenase (NAD(P)+)